LPDDGNKIAFFYGEIDVFEHVHAVFACAEIAVDVFAFYERHGFAFYLLFRLPLAFQAA